jgi:hypothetical protein
MKTKITLLALGSVFLMLTSSSQAQISESEQSVNVLAVQCSVSSGFSRADFDDYSRRLAKTLALLSPAQQTRVFGYLPQPGATMDSGGDDLPASPGQLLAQKSSGETGSSALDGLVSLVGGLNAAVSGNTSAKSAPVYAAASISHPEASKTAAASVSPIPLSSTVTAGDALPETKPAADGGESLTTAAAVTNADATKQKFSWDAVLAWFKQAGSAYEDGNLKAFLQGDTGN